MNTMKEKLPQAFSRFLIASIVAMTMSCNDGSDGLTSLMNVTNEAAGAKCLDGGLKVETGIDTNRNGTLDSGEVQQTEFVCNGVNNQNSLTKYTTELSGQNCSAGGQKIETGRDSNGDGTLEENEIQQTMFVCNGMNGVSMNQLRFKITTTGMGSFTAGAPLGVNPYYELINFDIRNYPGIDSVIFVVDGAHASDPNGTVAFQLYDVTNHTPIVDSDVSTTSTSGTKLYSRNILSKLPQSTIDLSAGILPSGECQYTYLLLYDRD
ncbi:MAG TPA: hypothetical protein VIU12_13160 [Chryseolinea sp.]